MKAELGFSAADYFSLVYEKIAARADVNMDDLTGTELEQAETALFKQAVAESIRATMWVGDTSAASGYNTFDGFLKTVKAGAMQEKFYNSICQAEDFSDPEKVVAVLDDLWMNADERVKDMKADGQLAFFVTSDIYYALRNTSTARVPMPPTWRPQKAVRASPTTAYRSWTCVCSPTSPARRCTSRSAC